MDAAEASATSAWKDHKRYLWLLGLLVPLFPFMGGGLVALTGWSVFWYIGPVLLFIVIPAIDLLAGVDRANVPDDLLKVVEADRYYRWITYLFLPLPYLGLVWACWLWAGDTLGDPRGTAGVAVVVADDVEACPGQAGAEVLVPPDHRPAQAHHQQQRVGVGRAEGLVADLHPGADRSEQLRGNRYRGRVVGPGGRRAAHDQSQHDRLRRATSGSGKRPPNPSSGAG